jgi:rhodanese-related sulfurtransferase
MATPGVHTAAGDSPWPQALRQGLVLLLVSAAVTAVSWALRGDRLPLRADRQAYELELAAPLVQPDAALLLFDEGEVLFADTRTVAAGDLVIPGAFPLRQDTLDDDLLAVFDFLEPETPLLLYGDGSLLATSAVAARLAERGYTDLRILAGGVGAWRQAGGDVRPADPEAAP